MINLPKQVTRTMYVIYQTDPWVQDENRVTLMPFDSSRYGGGDICLGTVEVTFDVPQQVDVVGAQVANLRARRDAVVAEMTAKTAEIDRQIQELLALPATSVEAGQ